MKFLLCLKGILILQASLEDKGTQILCQWRVESGNGIVLALLIQGDMG